MSPGFFIERPIFSTVISVLIVIFGLIGLNLLPIEQYPNITPPIVKISASYPGASATTVSQAVATPIEQELNGTPGMIYMESSSSNSGSVSITVTFDVSTNVDLAAVEVQNRVKLAESRLPAEVLQNGISVEKQAPNQLLTIALVSDDPKFDEIYLSNYATINVLDVIRRIPGVGRVSNVGSRYYGMQIWVYPDKMASFGLTVKDLQAAIKDQNRESAAGELGKQPIANIDVAMPITAQGRLSTVSDFEEIVVKANSDGSFIRMRDVARVSLEASSYNTESGLNGKNAAILSIYMLPGANAMEVAKEVKNAVKDIEKSFPEGLDYLIPFDMTQYISESIHEVYKTLFEALFLVILVVYLSLQNWRAAIIPIVAVPISLIGTFGFMLLFGFSLNMLTLLGLVLAIGIVVDDAIVVVENVERIMAEKGVTARQASHIAMKELSGALIATSLVLAAVFVPVSFLDGITGSLYRQFSVTIVVSVLISAIVALTLSPAMCAIILRPESHKKKIKLFRLINYWLAKGNKKYTRILVKAFNNPRRVMAGFGMVLVFIFVLNKVVPTSFIPQEDQGFFTVELEMPEGTTLDRMNRVTERAIAYLNKHEAVDYVQNVTGSSPRVGTNQSRSTLTVILKAPGERSMPVEAVVKDVQKEFYNYPEAKAYVNLPPVIPGLGGAGGVEMKLQARTGASWDDLVAATDTFMYYASQSKEIANVSSSLQSEIPQLFFDLDRDRAMMLGIPMSDIFATMKAYLGSVYVNDFNMFNRIYRVYIQADQSFRGTQDDINMFFVKTSKGDMVPLTALGSSSYTTGPGNISRFNMYTSASMQVTPDKGYSSGETMENIEQIVKDHLPETIGVAWSGLSFQENKASGQTGIVLALVFLFVFLFLAAQYESWTVPIAVVLSLPIATLGAYLGIWVLGLNNDVYFQIGLVTLMGLAAKNAILIVEFAKVQVDNGMMPIAAALQAARLRFRPILMTSLAFVLGMLPMVIASGPGSASRHSIGTGVFFGMIVAITLGIILIPFFFVMIYKLKNHFSIPELQFPRFFKKRKKMTIKYLIAITSIFSVFITSCKIGKEYSRPVMEDMPSTFDDNRAFEEGVPSDIGWSTFYTDTILQKLIDKALDNNKDVLIATARIKEMIANKRIKFAGLFPEVGIEGLANREFLNYGGHSQNYDPEVHGNFTAKWEIDIWGNLRWQNEGGIAQYMQSVEAQRALKLTIVAQVAQTYFGLKALDRELAIVKQTLISRKEAVHFAKLRYDGGLTSEIPYRQSLVELARTETLVPSLENEIKLQENDLFVLMGEFPSEDIIRSYSQFDLDEEIISTPLIVDLPSTLLERRPDVREAEQKLIKANADVGVALTDMFPKLTLTGNLGAETDEFSNFLKSPTWFVQGLLTGPVFNMGKNKAKHKAAQAAFEQELYRYQKTIINLFKEVNNAIITYQKVKEVRASREGLYESATSYLKLARLQYINGITNYIDVLDAQRQLFDAEISLNDAVLQELLAAVSLYKMLGGGLEK